MPNFWSLLWQTPFFSSDETDVLWPLIISLPLLIFVVSVPPAILIESNVLIEDIVGSQVDDAFDPHVVVKVPQPIELVAQIICWLIP